MGLMTLLEGPLMLAAASAGDVSTIRSRLERNPQRVCEHFMYYYTDAVCKNLTSSLIPCRGDKYM